MISGASERGGGLGYSLHLEAATSFRESHTPNRREKEVEGSHQLIGYYEENQHTHYKNSRQKERDRKLI